MGHDENTGRNTGQNPKEPTAFEKNRHPQWKPGIVTNPKGRPKGAKHGIRAHLRLLLKTNAPDKALAKLKAAHIDCGEGTMAEALAAVLAIKALAGDANAIREVMKQTEKPIPAVSLSAKVSKEEIEPYMDTEVANGDRQKDRSAKALSPNARDIAAALDRE